MEVQLKIEENFSSSLKLLVEEARRGEADLREVSLTELALEIEEVLRRGGIGLEELSLCLLFLTTLIWLKSQFLLPSSEKKKEEEESSSFGEEEYLDFKTRARWLWVRWKEEEKVFTRSFFQVEKKSEVYREVDIFSLLASLSRVLKEEEGPILRVRLYPVTLEEKERKILSLLKKRGEVNFFLLFRGETKLGKIITFLALLQLIKEGDLGAYQKRPFGEIIIYQR